MSAETVSLETALELKRDGQQQSLWDVTRPEIEDMRDAVLMIAPGALFTVNDLRARLDRAGVRKKVRAALLRSCVGEGLCRPEMVELNGETYQIRIPSTGKSAHAATVVVYRRFVPTPVPAVA